MELSGYISLNVERDQSEPVRRRDRRLQKLFDNELTEEAGR